MINNANSTIGNISVGVDNQTDKALTSPSAEGAPSLSGLVQTSDTAAASEEIYIGMQKAIRSVGGWLVGWAVFSAIDLNFSWAIALAVVALMSFYFSDLAAMFVVYAGVMLWAAVWNIFLSGDPMWIFAGAVQVVFAVTAIRNYRKYRNAKVAYESGQVFPDTPAPAHRESRMAWLALLLGSVILVGIVGFVLFGVIASSIDTSPYDDLVFTIFSVILELSALGMPVGIAALIAGYRHKAAAAAGIVLGLLSCLVSIASVMLAATL